MGLDLYTSLIKYSSTQLAQEFGDFQAACSDVMPPGEYMWGGGQGDLPIPFQYCYSKKAIDFLSPFMLHSINTFSIAAEGEIEFTQADADAANCLVNLHYTQDDACISIKGSMCEDGYDGMLQNARMSYISGPYQISSDESISFQGAINKMVGAKMRTDKTNDVAHMPAVSLVSKTNGVGMVAIYFRYIGEDEC
ncbi:hypothetical protein N7478_007719 [Penicillium angulare]|uniref:uncharacterized protein n=1 Tax=Penicillium angulare TaxID=116970 RepID=UPI00253F6C1F|nr:uncharacterized protein N7478_007719 [Penicillium angulare]KAJ5272594.1 hypothetical protein N7478_007719 [Penicillium angulare]